MGLLRNLVAALFPSQYRPRQRAKSGFEIKIRQEARAEWKSGPVPDSLKKFKQVECMCGSHVFRLYRFVGFGAMTASYRCWKCQGVGMMLKKKDMEEMKDALSWIGKRRQEYQV